ncbi:uncharacterized protein LOC118407802 [Branchiostoma floridae]|uniref:Uncharacterized protein LOC118407802 n=1 Tax=Branchiostoma floridae TaxID=7739 RepID=A0A9J7KKY3_BRAFL|nr:uncharacterized protein LOC118407802 [Branchiostoma floridae]
MNTVLLTLDVDIAELTAEILQNFKAVVAREMTSFCRRYMHELVDCRVSGPARSYIAAVFTAELVFIPPGYPQQSAVPGQTLLAFFVAHPDSLGANLRPIPISNVRMMMDTSVEEVAMSLGDTGRITDVQPLLDYIYGEDATTMIPTERKEESDPEGPDFPLQTVIIAVCGALAVTIVAVIGTTWYCKRGKTRHHAPITVFSAPQECRLDLHASNTSLMSLKGTDSPFLDGNVYSGPLPERRLDPVHVSAISLKGRDSPFLTRTNLWE